MKSQILFNGKSLRKEISQKEYVEKQRQEEQQQQHRAEQTEIRVINPTISG